MKLLKNFRFIYGVLLIIGISLIGCSKIEENSIVPTPETIVKGELQLIGIVKVDQNNEVYQKFLNSATYQTLKDSIADLKVLEIQIASYNRKEIGGLIVTISPKNGFKRDVMIAYNKSQKTEFYGLLREHNIKLGNDGKATGEIKWYTPTHDILNEMKVVGNHVTNFETYVPKTDVSSKSARQGHARLVWRCTHAQFNQHYQDAKNTCESNWFCDLTCNFAPCGVDYVAYAVDHCTEWVYYPNGTPIPEPTRPPGLIDPSWLNPGDVLPPDFRNPIDGQHQNY
jgi:hypothetical protein